MVDLDEVLTRTLEKARPHTRKVYGQNPLTGREILEMANTRAMMSLASTIGLNGRPHMSPMDMVGVEGRLFVGADESTAHYRNLQRNPAVAMMLLDAWNRQAIIEGTVQFLDVKSRIAWKVLEAEKKKSGWTTEAVGELRPEKVFSWRKK